MKNNIEINLITYNEEVMLPFTIAHYRRMFINPRFIIHDNGSTDNTIGIALREGCFVREFKTEGMNDTIQSQIKSKAVVESESNWVLVIDADEEILLTLEDLDDLDKRGINIVQFEGWNIFDNKLSPWEVNPPMGIQDGGYSKPILVKGGVFDIVEYAPGAHTINKLIPKEGEKVMWSKNEFKLLHYKHWSCEYNINRSKELGARQSADNLRNRHSFHFSFPENVHKDWYDKHFAIRQIIEDKRLS